MTELPGNSHRQREGSASPPNRPKVERVVTGPVIQRKTPLRQKFKSTFLGGNPKEAIVNTFTNSFVPRAKEVFLDTLYEGMDRMVLGEARAATARRNNGLISNIFGPNPSVSQYVPYNAFGTGQPSQAQMQQQTAAAAILNNNSNQRIDLGQIIIPSKVEADALMTKIIWHIEEFAFFSVADLYEMLGLQAPFTDEKYGWNDVRELAVRPVSGGYLLVLPQPTHVG